MNKFFYTGLLLLNLCYIKANAQWAETNAPQGNSSNITRIVADNGNLYTATWGNGVHKSTDGGASWTPVNNGLNSENSSNYIGALAAVPASSGVGTYLFAGTQGIWRSSDEGASWVKVFPDDPEGGIPIIAMGATGNTALAGTAQIGTDNGVYRSTDDGQFWARCNGGFTTAADSNVRCFASIKAGNTTYTYAGTDGGVFISTNEGASWTRISDGLPASRVESIIATPKSSGTGVNIFAGVFNYGVYRSADNGLSWTESNNGLFVQGQTPYVSAFAASPVPGGTTTNIFVAYRTNVFLSTNNGEIWEDTGWPAENGGANTLVINGGMLYGGSSAEIWKYSMEADTSWVVQQSGISDSLICVKAVNNNVVWAGGINGTVLHTSDSGTTWDSVGGGPIGSDMVNAIEAFNYNSALIASCSLTGGKIFKTSDGGSSWSPVFNQTGAFIGGIQMKNSLEGYAVGSPVGGKWLVLKTTDGGISWNNLTTAPVHLADDFGPTGVQLRGDTLWFGTWSGSVYRSTDLGLTWTTSYIPGYISYGPYFNSSAEGLSGSFSDGSFFRSTDGGTSWDTPPGKISQPVTCISGMGHEFWATTGGSIAYSANMGQSWSFAAPGHGGITPLSALSFSPVVSPLNGWAVGASGLILHYRHGATTPSETEDMSLSNLSGLEQNFPNPFASKTTINFKVKESGMISIKVFDCLGTEVAILVNERKLPGDFSIEWNATELGPGIYFCILHNETSFEVKKMLLVK
ncbi:MAG: T9SS type A sorting domain-containing protein [Bacteroidota bacterium]